MIHLKLYLRISGNRLAYKPLSYIPYLPDINKCTIHICSFKSVSYKYENSKFNVACSADADFSCFADLAVTSPVDYYKEGEGSLMQCVLTPADPYMPLDNDAIAAKVDK